MGMKKSNNQPSTKNTAQGDKPPNIPEGENLKSRVEMLAGILGMSAYVAPEKITIERLERLARESVEAGKNNGDA